MFLETTLNLLRIEKVYKAFLRGSFMEINVIKSEKNDAEISVSNTTIAEILRVYLNEQGVEFAAWRKEHPSKPVVLKIQTSGKSVKKAISDAVSAIKKDSEKLVASLKK